MDFTVSSDGTIVRELLNSSHGWRSQNILKVKCGILKNFKWLCDIHSNFFNIFRNENCNIYNPMINSELAICFTNLKKLMVFLDIFSIFSHSWSNHGFVSSESMTGNVSKSTDNACKMSFWKHLQGRSLVMLHPTNWNEENYHN